MKAKRVKHLNMFKHILGSLSFWVSSLLLTVSVRQALVDLLNSGECGFWQMKGYMLVVAAEPRAENRRLLGGTSLPQGALGMPVLKLPGAVTKLAFLLQTKPAGWDVC